MKKGHGNLSRKVSSSGDLKYKSSVIVLFALFLVFGLMLNFTYNNSSFTGKVINGDQNNNGICDEEEIGCYYTDDPGFQPNPSVNSDNVFANFFSTLNTILSGEQDVNQSFYRWTFFIVLSILFFSIFSTIGWPAGKFAMWIAAIPLAFLSIALISRTDFLASIQQFGALGLTFITILPLAIMFLFSSQLLQGNVTVGKVIFQLLLWYYFLIFDIYVLLKYVAAGIALGTTPWYAFWSGQWWSAITDINNQVLGFGVIIIALSGLVVLLVIIFNRRFREWVRNIGRELRIEIGRDTAAAAESLRTAGGGPRGPGGFG